MYACQSSQGVFSKKREQQEFHAYLLKVLNDTSTFEIPALRIVDDKLYPILDSVINSTEQCEYFNERIRYLHAFQFSARNKNGRRVYSVYALGSIESALGLFTNRAVGKNTPMDCGIFYYKNYLFSVPLDPYLQQIDIDFPFVVRSGCNYRIAAPNLYNEKAYPAYMNFVQENNQYIIIADGICEGPLLID